MKLRDLIQQSQATLTPLYGDGESKWLVRTILEHLKGWNPVDVALRQNDEVSDFIVGKCDNVISRLMKKEPIQYIFGDTYWYGMNLVVSPAVLIPRPETEELVDMIVKDNNGSDLSVLDMCTGSGCIAIALAKNLPFSKVRGMDISKEAVEIARKNAIMQHVKVDFYVNDVMTVNSPGEIFDIIVSNPPYIAEKEKSSMDKNVLEYEPETALFVPDNNPLKFYKSISTYAYRSLKPGGKLYFEINPLYNDELMKYLSHNSWADIELYRDMYGKNRFIKATKQH